MNPLSSATRSHVFTVEAAAAVGMTVDMFRKKLARSEAARSLGQKVGHAWLWPRDSLPMLAAALNKS